MNDNRMRYAVMNPYCHMDVEELERFSTGRVSEEEMEQFEEHLLTCELCQQRFEESDNYVLATRSAALKWREEKAARRSWWTLPRLVPVLAGMALLIVGILALTRFTASAPPMAVALTATRGTVAGGTVVAGRSMMLSPDLTGLANPGPYRLEIVDARGTVTWQGSYNATDGAVPVPAQRVGVHFVRVYARSGELLREYGLDVQTAPSVK